MKNERIYKTITIILAITTVTLFLNLLGLFKIPGQEVVIPEKEIVIVEKEPLYNISFLDETEGYLIVKEFDGNFYVGIDKTDEYNKIFEGETLDGVLTQVKEFLNE